MRLVFISGISAVLISVTGCQTASETDRNKQISRTTQSERLMKLAADIEGQGDVDTAIALYEKASSSPDAPAVALVRTGDAYLHAGYVEKASVAYQSALAKYPGNGPALLGLGSAMIESGDLDAGIRALQQAAPMVGTSKAYNQLGVAQTFAGEFELAQTAYDKARHFAPTDVDIQINMALAHALNNNEYAITLVGNLAASPAAQLRHKRNVVLVYAILGRGEEIKSAPPVGLSSKEVNQLLQKGAKIRAKSSPKDKVALLGSISA